jgi:hypothetical protein
MGRRHDFGCANSRLNSGPNRDTARPVPARGNSPKLPILVLTGRPLPIRGGSYRRSLTSFEEEIAGQPPFFAAGQEDFDVDRAGEVKLPMASAEDRRRQPRL